MNKKKNGSLNWKYHIANLLLLVLSIVAIYLGARVYDNAQVISIGYWGILVSIIALFAKNIYYLAESSEPENLISLKNSPRP